MKVLNQFEGAYVAPQFDVVEISVERGFEGSIAQAGFEGPIFDEEDVVW